MAIEQNEKQRLFVDMDGTLAVFTPVDEIETLYQEGYFYNLVPHENVVEAIKEIVSSHPDIDVHILSAYLTDSPYALAEKEAWLDKYLPEVAKEKRVFVPMGSEKKDFVEGGIKGNDFLLDDYTKNLTEWQPPARGIKLLNAINHSKGSWDFDRIRYNRDPSSLATGIVDVMKGNEVIKDDRVFRTSDLSVNTSVLSSYSGQTNFEIVATFDGKPVGYIQFAEYEEKPHIQYIEVGEEFRRQGIATVLMKELQSQYLHTPIEWGMTTEDGSKLYNAITYTVENKEAINLFNQIEQTKTDILENEQALNSIYEIEELNAEEEVTLRRLGEVWDGLQDRLSRLEADFEGMSTSSVFVNDGIERSFEVDKNISDLASRLHAFAYDYDPYHYADVVGVDGFDEVGNNLLAGNVESYISFLQNALEDDSTLTEAQNLIDEIRMISENQIIVPASELPIEDIATLDYINNPARQGSGGAYRASDMLREVFRHVESDFSASNNVYSRYDGSWTQGNLNGDFQPKIAILQYGEYERNHSRRFTNMRDLEEILHENPSAENYELVYIRDGAYPLQTETARDNMANRLFTEFNSVGLRPVDYYGHSLSVGDVVIIQNDFNDNHAYFVDSFGFTKLPDDFITRSLEAKIRNGITVKEEFSLYQSVINAQSEHGISLLNNTQTTRAEELTAGYEDIFVMAERRGLLISMEQDFGFSQEAVTFNQDGSIQWGHSLGDTPQLFVYDSWDDLKHFVNAVSEIKTIYSVEEIVSRYHGDKTRIADTFSDREIGVAAQTSGFAIRDFEYNEITDGYNANFYYNGQLYNHGVWQQGEQYYVSTGMAVTNNLVRHNFTPEQSEQFRQFISSFTAQRNQAEELMTIQNLEYEDGYLHFTVIADGYDLEGLYRIYDPENGNNQELVSIDYGDRHPIIERQWNRLEDALKEMTLDRFNQLSGAERGEQEMAENNSGVEVVTDEHSKRIFTLAQTFTVDDMETELDARDDTAVDGLKNPDFADYNTEEIVEAMEFLENYEPTQRRYYEPEFDFDGTADELFIQARNNYIENPDALSRLSAILEAEGRVAEAERVRYMEEREREDTSDYSVSQMKLDFMDGVYSGLDDFHISDELALSVMYEQHDDSVIISLQSITQEDGEMVISTGASNMTLDEFKAMTREDFEVFVGQVHSYSMVEEERTPIIEKEQEIQPIQEFFRSDNGLMVEGDKIPSLPLIEAGVTSGYASREAVYNAVLEFERANNVAFPTIDENGSYEDKDFLYDAYDRYVAMSHADELEQYEGMGDGLRAELYYAKRNGVSGEEFALLEKMCEEKALLDYADMSNIRLVRNVFQDGGSIEEATMLASYGDVFVAEPIYDFMQDGATAEQLDALKNVNEQSLCHISISAMKYDNKSADEVKLVVDYLSEFNTWRKEEWNANRDTEFSPFTIENMAEDLLHQSSPISESMLKAYVDKVKEERTLASSYGDFVSSYQKELERSVAEKSAPVTIDADLTPNEQLRQRLENGVRSVLDSENFKNWLNTGGKLFYNNYSFRNAMLVWLQKPDASYVMGYEKWKEFGRNVAQGAVGAKVLVPIMASEKYKGGLFRSIKSNLLDQLAKNPSLQTASYRLGNSTLEFTMNKANHLIGFSANGKEQQIFGSDDDVKRFIDRAIIGKVPTGFTAGNVFDKKDVIIPEVLWVRNGYKKEDLVLDDKGNPIKNRRGEYKIVNTPERQARFQPDLETYIVAKDPVKMKALFETCVAVSEKKGVPVSLATKEEDKTLQGGASGYYSRSFTDEHPNGYIVIDSSLEITDQCAVLLHEMGHADLHKDLAKLAEDMGIDGVDRQMREVQAEATAYAVGSTFGIETSTRSFEYLAVYSRGFDLQDFQKSLETIFKEAQSLTAEIKAELDIRGLNLDLTEKPKAMLESETLKELSTAYMDYISERGDIARSAMQELPSLVKQSEGNDKLIDILKYQKENLDGQQEFLATMTDNVELLNTATTREKQDEALAVLETLSNRMRGSITAFDWLTENYMVIVEQARGGLKVDFENNPMKTLEKMKKDFPALASLSKPQLEYIASSKFVSREFIKLLRNNPQEFVAKVTERAEMLSKVASKNGTFVEVNFCEQWTDKPFFEHGTLCSPKIADVTVTGCEAQARGFAKEAEKRGEYFPYSKCDVTVFTPSEKGKLISINTRVDIGDGGQSSLRDHMEQVCRRGANRKEVLANFTEALTERAYKSKLVVQDLTISAPPVVEEEKKAPVLEGNLSSDEWSREIAAEKGKAEEQPQEHTTNERNNSKNQHERDGK